MPLAALAEHPLILPPDGQPAARRGRRRGRAPSASTLRVPIEVEGIRLIADLVAAGAGVSILPETAVPDDHPRRAHRARSRGMPPRRLALITARGVQLSLADQAVHDAVRVLVRSSA